MSFHNLKHLSNSVARRAQKAANDWAASYWHDFPMGRAPRASADTYTSLWETERKKEYPEMDQLEKDLEFKIDQPWFHALAKQTQIVIKNSPMCYQHGRVLYTALRHYIANTKPEDQIKIIETGTARAFSAIVMARALKDSGTAGQIFTFDILPHHSKMYWNCIADTEGPKTRADLIKGWSDLVEPYVTFVEGDTRLNLPKVATGRIHFAFLDGAHTYKDVKNEFDLIAARQKGGDVIVFDDYSADVFEGLVVAVDEGCERLGYDKKVITASDRRAYVIARKKDNA